MGCGASAAGGGSGKAGYDSGNTGACNACSATSAPGSADNCGEERAISSNAEATVAQTPPDTQAFGEQTPSPGPQVAESPGLDLTFDSAALGSTAKSLASSSAEYAALFEELTHVMISGLEKRPDLNGKLGLVLSYEGGEDRRYTVRVAGALVKLKESKLSAAPAGAAPPPPAEPETAVTGPSPEEVAAAEKAMASKLDECEKYPQGELTAKGALIPTYHWVKVPSIATLPPGLEIWMPLNGMKCARIPSSWRLQVVADGQVDCYRSDVTEYTPMTEVLNGVSSTFGWDVQSVELRADGGPLVFEADATVGSAALFGRKLTTRKR